MSKEIQILPQNLAAERSCLGCQILWSSKVPDVREIIGPEDYHSDINGKVQRAINRLCDGGAELDVLTLAAQLQSTNQLDEIGGPAYINELFESVPDGAHATFHAELVAECSRRRKMIVIGRGMADKAFDMSVEDSELMESTIKSAMQLSTLLAGADKSKPRTVSDHVIDIIGNLSKGESTTFFWGIDAIDSMIGGTAAGELIVIGGRPSHGKSMVGLQWLDCASERGIPGLMISEEMSASSLAARSLSSITTLTKHEWKDNVDRLFFDVRQHFTGRAPILIAEKCSTAAKAERAIAQAVQSHNIRIVVIDYAQLLHGDGDTKEQRIADVSSRMKAAAMRYDIVVLLLAQLNRQIEGRDNPSPQLSDLRDSGGIENDADVAIFPFWPFKFDDTYEDPNEYRIYCRKNRNRGIRDHVIKMRINPERQRLYTDNQPDEWERH